MDRAFDRAKLRCVLRLSNVAKDTCSNCGCPECAIIVISHFVREHNCFSSLQMFSKVW